MKKIIYFLLFVITITTTYAQNLNSDNSSEFVLGNGLVINSGNDYHFKLSGLIQPAFSVSLDANNTDYLFSAKHTFFSFSGFAKPERVSFLMLTDFSLPSLSSVINKAPSPTTVYNSKPNSFTFACNCLFVLILFMMSLPNSI